MTDDAVLRLFAFRPADLGSVFDAALRDRVLPAFVSLPGLVDAFVGRQGPDETGTRLVVSVWESADAMRSALDPAGASGGFPLERAAAVQDPELTVLPLRIAIGTGEDPAPTVLRIFRGTVREGELDAYLADVASGTEEDIAKGTGPLALYLAVEEPVGVVTVSVWATWDALAGATGGNARQPIRTRNAGRLVSWTATHYEVLPDAVGRPVRPARVAE